MSTVNELIKGDGQKEERFQRKVLSNREEEIELFQRRVEEFLGAMPYDFAKTDIGAELVSALQGAGDYLTILRRSIRRETAPLEKD